MSDEKPVLPDADAKSTQTVEIDGEKDSIVDRAYVERLRRENQAIRQRAKAAEEKAEKEAAERLAEQGKYKDLYEAEKAKAKDVDGLTAKIASYEAREQVALEETLKSLNKEGSALFDSLADKLDLPDRLKLAQSLAGKKHNLPPEPRPGAGDNLPIDSAIEAYKKGNRTERASLLMNAKATNQKLYDVLIQTKI